MHKTNNYFKGDKVGYHSVNQNFKLLIYCNFSFLFILSLIAKKFNPSNIANYFCKNIYFSALGQIFFQYNLVTNSTKQEKWSL